MYVGIHLALCRRPFQATTTASWAKPIARRTQVSIVPGLYYLPTDHRCCGKLSWAGGKKERVAVRRALALCMPMMMLYIARRTLCMIRRPNWTHMRMRTCIVRASMQLQVLWPNGQGACLRSRRFRVRIPVRPLTSQTSYNG
jgi:hypothetical protein